MSPDFVALVGAERLRKLLTAVGRRLRVLPEGGEVLVRLRANARGEVVNARVGTEEGL